MGEVSRRSFLLGAGAVGIVAATGLAACAPGAAGSGASAGSSAAATGSASKPTTYTDRIRSMVIGLNSEVQLANGKFVPAVNFDNGAVTPPLAPVFNEVNSQLEYFGSIGSGKCQKSVHSTDIYESGRLAVMRYVNADPDIYTTFYVMNTTEGLNRLASALITSPDDIVLTSRMEHNSNDLPWRRRCKVLYADVDDKGRLLMSDIERLLQANQVKIVTICAATNVTGYVNDVHAIARLAHAHGAQIIVDGAQIAARRAFSMAGSSPEEDIDYFVFSAVKIYAPYGSGAVVGRTDDLNKHMPGFYGGGMMEVVSDYSEVPHDAPALYEAGTANYPGVVAMAKATEVLLDIGFGYIEEHEQFLIRKTIDGLLEIPGVVIYGDTENITDRVGIVTFNIEGLTPDETAQKLADKAAVAVRQGVFAAHPYVFRLLGIPDAEITQHMHDEGFVVPGVVRISFGMYNTEEEVDILVKTIKEIAAEV